MPGGTLFTNATLLDTTTMRYRPGMDVRVEGSRIAEVAEHPIVDHEAEAVDCLGHVLMPGLIDAHVHITAATLDFGALAAMPPSLLTASAAPVLRGMLMRGFTTVRDAGGADRGHAEAVARGLFPGPRLFISGKALSQTGGHGDFRPQVPVAADSCGCAHLHAGLGRIADGVAEVRRAARDEIRLGANQIKVMASGGVASPTDPVTYTQYSLEELRAIVEEAEAAETYAMAHAYTARAIRRCIAAGVRSIEHGNLIDRETADLMAERGTFLVPTLAAYHTVAEHGRDLGFPDYGLRKLHDVLEAGTRALDIAKAAGVTMVFGTDLLGDLRGEQMREFGLRSEVLSAAEIVAAATVNAAKLLQREGELGVVRPGARADLLLVDGDPLADLGVFDRDGTRLQAIMQDGVFAKPPAPERRAPQHTIEEDTIIIA